MTYNIKKQISCIVQVFVIKCAQSAIDFFLYKGNKIYYVTTANIDNKYFSCHQKYIIILNKIYTKLDDNWKTNTQFCV